MTTTLTRLALRVVATAALAVGALASASSANTTADDAAGHLSPRVVERQYLTCIDGAPTSPDARDHWVAGCRDDVPAADAPVRLSPRVVERAFLACIHGAPTTADAHEHWVAGCREHTATGLS